MKILKRLSSFKGGLPHLFFLSRCRSWDFLRSSVKTPRWVFAPYICANILRSEWLSPKLLVQVLQMYRHVTYSINPFSSDILDIGGSVTFFSILVVNGLNGSLAFPFSQRAFPLLTHKESEFMILITEIVRRHTHSISSLCSSSWQQVTPTSWSACLDRRDNNGSSYSFHDHTLWRACVSCVHTVKNNQTTYPVHLLISRHVQMVEVFDEICKILEDEKISKIWKSSLLHLNVVLLLIWQIYLVRHGLLKGKEYYCSFWTRVECSSCWL